MIEYPHPSHFDKALSDDLLNYVAKLMLQSFDSSYKSTRDPYDDNYTFGTVFFKRNHNLFNEEFNNDLCPYDIKVIDRSNKFIFKIGDTYCRFFEEKNYFHPTKKGAFVLQPQLSLFNDIGLPSYSNFLLMYTLDEDNLPLPVVRFVSYDINGNIVAFWEHNASNTTPSIPTNDLYTPSPNTPKRPRNMSSKHKQDNESK